MGEPKIGYFPGAWDFLHAGHVMALEEAKGSCDYLIVGLGGSPQIGNEAKNTPVMSIEERYRMLRANKFVDAIVIYESEHESIALDKWFPYDVRFMGADHKGKDHSARIHKPIIYISRNHNYSSTRIRNLCK
mgnify:CR=1 FL=1